MSARRAGSVALGVLLGLLMYVGLELAGVVPYPWDIAEQHQATKNMMNVEWGIRTFPQDDR